MLRTRTRTMQVKTAWMRLMLNPSSLLRWFCCQRWVFLHRCQVCTAIQLNHADGCSCRTYLESRRHPIGHRNPLFQSYRKLGGRNGWKPFNWVVFVQTSGLQQRKKPNWGNTQSSERRGCSASSRCLRLFIFEKIETSGNRGSKKSHLSEDTSPVKRL